MSDSPVTKRKINFIYVDGERSPFSDIRGRAALSYFERNWRRMAEVNPTYTNARAFSRMEITDFTNTIWLDNVRDMVAVNAAAAAKIKNPEISIIYALDEYVWEAPGGRASVLADVRVVERAIEISDRLVVPNDVLSGVIKNVLGVIRDDMEIVVVPTFTSAEFFPTQASLIKSKANLGFTAPKPKVLVKGVELPENVQKFIERNYKEMDITISTICELSPKLVKHVNDGKVQHLRHWSNPDVNHSNALLGIARERDMRFDFTIVCKPEDLTGNFYEISLGDDDVLFAISSGSLPIAIADHVGYDKASLYYASGLCLSASCSADDIENTIKNNKHPDTWNLAMAKAIVAAQNRIAGSTAFLGTYYRALVGNAAVEAESEFLNNAIKERQAAQAEADAKAEAEEKPKNVVQF